MGARAFEVLGEHQPTGTSGLILGNSRGSVKLASLRA